MSISNHLRSRWVVGASTTLLITGYIVFCILESNRLWSKKLYYFEQISSYADYYLKSRAVGQRSPSENEQISSFSDLESYIENDRIHGMFLKIDKRRGMIGDIRIKVRVKPVVDGESIIVWSYEMQPFFDRRKQVGINARGKLVCVDNAGNPVDRAH